MMFSNLSRRFPLKRIRTSQTCVRFLCQAGTESFTICSQENGIRRIVLNNPSKRNAFCLGMLDAIKSNLLHDLDCNVKVIVISANGKVFSSGHDLKELTKEHGKDYHARIFHRCTEVMTLVQDLPVPVIAQVNDSKVITKNEKSYISSVTSVNLKKAGLATAAGCQLVASCDIAIASDKAKFATPGVNIGLFCSTPGVALARAVPRKVAMQMLLTGYPISADEALKHGLLSKVVPEESLDEEVNAIAEKIASSSQPVVAMGKAGFYSQVSKARDQAYVEAEAVMVENLELHDGQEGIKAFLEKRKPTWTNTTDCH